MEPGRVSGRSRGRARSRAAPGVMAPAAASGGGDMAATPGAADVRRPGVAAQPFTGAAAAPPAPRPVQPRSDMGLAKVTEGVQAMQMGDAGGRGSRRGRRDEPTWVKTRKEGLVNKQGTTGRAVTLSTNYFYLKTQPTWAVQQYHCDFIPIVESSRMRSILLREHREKLNNSFVFDGQSDLKTTAKLGQEVEWYSQRRSDDTQITIRIRHVNELAPSNPEILRLFNTQMRRNLEHLRFVQINRRYFDTNAVNQIPRHGLELWNGISTAIGQHDGGVLMVVDTIHKVLRRDSVLDALRRCAERGANYRDEAIRQVVGSICMTPYNNRTYKIDDIAWDRKPTDTFDGRDGPCTYIDYYKAQYEKVIQDKNQPLLVVRPKEKDLRGGRDQPIFLIPELCVMTGLTDEMRANFGLMKDLAQFTKLDPKRRVMDLKRFMARLKGNEKVQEEMGRWALEFSDEPIELQGRLLPPEKIFQGKNSSYDNDPETADFTRNLRGHHLLAPVTLERWGILCTKRDYDMATRFASELRAVGPPMGVNFANPRVITLPGDQASVFTNALKTTPSDVQLVMCIFPNNRKDRYDAVKRIACVDLGLPTQCMLSKTISNDKSVRSVATKVAIQMNCKMGGEAWRLNIPVTGGMVCGYDTYHDSSQKNRSAGGFCATLNDQYTRWYSRVSFHQSHQELGSCLKVHMACALQEYQTANAGKLPRFIIFYRDGVSDGQLLQVLEHEVAQIRAAITEISANAPEMPKLLFVVVTKRIACRFFLGSGEGSRNPLPGTIIDSMITRPERYDFYVVSQSVRQGSVAPTHFNVIYDDTPLTPEHIQRLSYKFCHLYFNWPGTIRVPAPCQYAHKLAFLAGQSLHEEPNSKLAKQLFYL